MAKKKGKIKMKKIKLWMMLFCIGLLFVSGGVAEEIALDLTQLARFETASSLCWIDDSLYVLGNKGVYSWKSGSEKMNTVIDLTAASNYDYVQDCPEDESEAAVWNQMLQLIFTDGEALYGLHPYSGMIKKIEGNTDECGRDSAGIPLFRRYGSLSRDPSGGLCR